MANISDKDINIILKKYERLKEVNKILKNEFVGLDDIIDEVCSLIETWYLFPDGQTRPTIINLWGMTGTGKTSLVIRLFELLEFNSILKIDIGEWVDRHESQLSVKISNQLLKIKKDNLVPILIFDEFQLGRTKTDSGDDIDRPGLRVIWDLLDTGKFSILEEKWESGVVYDLYLKLNFLYYNKGVEVKNGIIIKNKREWDIMFANLENNYDSSTDIMTKIYPNNAFIPFDAIWSIRKLNEEYLSDNQLIQYILTLDAKEILEFLEKTLEKSSKPTTYDFSKSIIFIIGNLDDVFSDSEQMSPDIDADTLYEHTKKITISHIKEALTLKYRPEQISRLGNNHIIYKSFNESMYKDIIKLELNKIINKVKNKFDIDIEFDNSINDIIYKEGVFPTQGARPVISTINVLVESYIGRIIVDSIKLKIDIKNIYWKFENDTHFIIINKGKKTFKYPVKLKIESVRKSKNDDIQSLIAVHEAGHIVTSIYSLNILPKMAISRNAEDNGGFTHIDLPEWENKDFLINNIICLIGGYCAEKIIFGENNITSGSYKDLKETTSIALKIIKEYGMNGLPIVYSTPNFRISSSAVCLNDDDHDKLAIKIVEDCMKKCEEILNDNMELLLAISDYLSKNSKITSVEIKEMVKKYGKYKMPDFKTKEDYYNYKKILNEKIKKMI